MKSILSISLLVLFFASTIQAQVQYSGEEFQSYTAWFHHSTYENDRYVSFVEGAPVHAQASSKAPVIGALSLGQVVTPPPGERAAMGVHENINGYLDQWVKINLCDERGRLIPAYVWGGYLAKNWQYHDIDQDGQLELLALGSTTETRRSPDHVNAELRVIQNEQLMSSLQLPGLCLFDDCGAKSQLRVLKLGGQLQVLEASVLTEGSLSGVDKVLLSWTDGALRLVHQAEFLTGHQYANRPLYYQHNSEVMVCYYGGENDRFAPVWDCKAMDTTVAVP